MRVICFGDSLTYGYGIAKEKSWVELLRSELQIEIANRGINGDTSTGMLSRLYTDIIKNVPTHVIIMGGTNDFLSGRTAKSVFDNITIMLKECLENNITPIIVVQPGIAPAMAKILWADGVDYEKINEKILDYRELIQKYSLENNIQYADLFSPFEKGLLNNSKDYFIDGLHPTQKGHIIIADVIIEDIKGL